MKIVIAHTEGYDAWLKDLIKSLDPEELPYEVITIEPGGWVTDQLKYAAELACFWKEDIFFLNETTIIKDPVIFDMAADIDGPAALSPQYLMFMGKFTPEQLQKVTWPKVETKRDDVILGEAGVCRDQLAPNVPVLCPDLVDPSYTDDANYVMRHGRKNLVLENAYITKYKANWSLPEA